MFSFLNSWFSMDFEGQRRAEKIFQLIIALSAVIGFFVGFVFQLFSYSIFTLVGGCILSCMICLFNWPWFQLKPLNWQKPLEPSSPGDTKKTK
ncbi:signal peptidase complex subunit 1-like [Varroa jacobsoni]|uniref:Signal peptidase complex subunit 1 n=1 Tax=Varroa destructor TaxID=109461 RepID=A0A7M7KW84_VARDE|nr:signal peptidase complex subunit 1-like [Varroa destructor]XP_022700632.1 signal peptidase complex subunit 1-like [Varroa jacobsoni]